MYPNYLNEVIDWRNYFANLGLFSNNIWNINGST